MDEDSLQSEDGSIGARISACLTGVLQACLGTCCSSIVRWLRAMGYEQVLVIRSLTHLSLWFSAVVSFVFTVIWFSDIFTLRCFASPLANRGYLKCIMESMGIFIFFAGFRDSIRMLAHFDDSKQRVLQEKHRKMDALELESRRVLEVAKANMERLRNQIVQKLEEHMVEYVREVFEERSQTIPWIRVKVILPSLDREVAGRRVEAQRLPRPHLQNEDHSEGGDPLPRLTELLRANVAEVDRLASVMYVELAHEHPDVFRRLPPRLEASGRALRLWDSWLRLDYPAVAMLSTAKQETGSSENGWMNLQAAAEVGPEAADVGSAASPTRRAAQLARAVGRAALEPVEELLQMPQRLEGLQAKITTVVSCRSGRDNRELRKQRLGFGKPPWGSRCTGCVPYSAAVVFRCLCSVFCICVCRRRRRDGLCRDGLVYPKKISCGFFWVQIFTRLQERLIQGLVWSALYCCFYSLVLFVLFDSFGELCLDRAGAGHRSQQMQTSECIMEMVRKCIGLWTLMAYIPCLLMCLYYIDNLDAVMETIETIWQLEDVHRAVRAFNRRMEEVADQVFLLQAIDDRVLSRTSFVRHFSSRIAAVADGCFKDAGRVARFRAVVEGLTIPLEAVAEGLGSARDWLRMSAEDREASAQHAQELLDLACSEQRGRPAASVGATSSTSTRPAVAGNFQHSVSIELTGLLSDQRPSGSCASSEVTTMPDGTFLEP